MRVIRVSEEVWQAIAARGSFGETENDVLERVFGIDKPKQTRPPMQVSRATASPHHKRQPFATIRMSAEVRGKILYVSFDHGPSDKWQLPENSDKNGIRDVRDKAVAFAKEHGASFGQEQAVKKALTNAGYWLVK